MKNKLLILFCFINIVGFSQGIEPSQIQGSSRLNDILKANIQYIDEYGDTIYIYEHTSIDDIIKKDSIYEELIAISFNGDYTYAVKLRDGLGEAVIPVTFPNYFLQGLKETNSLPNQNANTRIGISSLKGGVIIGSVDDHQFIFSVDTSSNNEVGLLSISNDTIYYKPCTECNQQYYKIPSVKVGNTLSINNTLVNDTLYSEVNPNSIDSTHIKPSSISLTDLSFNPITNITGTEPIVVSGSGNSRNIGFNGITGSGVDTRVAFWMGANTLSNSADLTWNYANSVLRIKGIPISSNALDQLYAGNGAGQNSTSANSSNFFGPNAGNGATNAYYANFFGNNAGQSATNSNSSNFFGSNAGNGASNASNANFFGTNAGNSTTNTYNSNFFGINAGNGATNANYSNFFGANAGLNAASADNSNFFGNSAGNGATNAAYSNFFGASAGLNATGASYSNFFGINAGEQATNAYYANFFGVNAGNGATNANYSNFFGINAGSGATNASNANFFGLNAGNGATNALQSNFVGGNAGLNATGASYSNFFGNSAGNGATNAAYSNFFGASAGLNATGASYSNFFGDNTGSPLIGSNNILIGRSVTLPDGTNNGMNIGSVLFGTGFWNSGTKNSTGSAGGRIGILTNSPQYTLDVNGSARIQDRSGSAIVGAGFDANGKIVEYQLDTETYINGGTNISVTGAGSVANPYVISNTFTQIFQEITTSGAAGNISLNNGGGTINLNVDDADSNPTNELQDLFAYSNGFVLDNPNISLNDTVIFSYATPIVINTPPSSCNCSVADIPTLTTQLNSKASTTHTHVITDVTGLQAALDAKANTSHTHTIANVTGLQAALDGKEAAFAKGSIIQGSGVTITGTLTDRLVGSGDITINAAGGGGVLEEAINTASPNITNSNTTISDISLGSGTYLINAYLTVTENNNVGKTLTVEIFNASNSTVLASTEKSINGINTYNIALSKKIVISSTSTIRLRAKTSNGTALSLGGKNSITALKI